MSLKRLDKGKAGMICSKMSTCLFITFIIFLTIISGCGGQSGSSSDGNNVPAQAALTALSLSGCTLSPSFDSSVTQYVSTVASDIPSITLTPTAQNPATITVNGQTIASGAASPPIPLSVGENAITVIVSSGTTTRTYRLTIIRKSGYWTWVSGDTIVNQYGIYGYQGIAAPSNKPGARDASASWTDGSGNFWLFGGGGYDQTGTRGQFNDLWRFDGTNWTWVSGGNIVDQFGVYGTKGIPSSSNKPGSRMAAVSWTGHDGSLWLFGGIGYAASGSRGALNDLWKFDGTNWTWVAGDSTTLQSGAYGVKGVPSSANKPGSRFFAVSWVDTSGNLWLFGGYGQATTVGWGGIELNDLWKFDGTNWTWVSGDSVENQLGIYGAKGASAPTNKPGSRDGSTSWTDGSGNFWLFGGYGYGATGETGWLNDLWQFDGTNWTWVSGDDTPNRNGVYGTKSVPSSANKPGGRDNLVSWIDRHGNFWLSGGAGFAATGGLGALNDLWRFDGNNWTWISGDYATNQSAVYGSKGVSLPTNKPGATQSRVAWTDAKGDLWFFGGRFFIDWTNDTYGNDMWKFEP